MFDFGSIKISADGLIEKLTHFVQHCVSIPPDLRNHKVTFPIYVSISGGLIFGVLSMSMFLMSERYVEGLELPLPSLIRFFFCSIGGAVGALFLSWANNLCHKREQSRYTIPFIFVLGGIILAITQVGSMRKVDGQGLLTFINVLKNNYISFTAYCLLGGAGTIAVSKIDNLRKIFNIGLWIAKSTVVALIAVFGYCVPFVIQTLVDPVGRDYRNAKLTPLGWYSGQDFTLERLISLALCTFVYAGGIGAAFYVRRFLRSKKTAKA